LSQEYFHSREDDDKSSNKTQNSSIGSYSELLFTTKSNIGWIAGLAVPTGWVILVILFILSAFSLPVIRRKGYFQVNLLIL